MSGVLKQVLAGPVRPGCRLRIDCLNRTASITLEELHERAGRVARWLASKGLGRGDRIGILAANSLEWVTLDLAALWVGAVVAGLEPGKFAGDRDLAQRYELALVVSDRPDVAGAVSLGEIRAAADERGTPAAPEPVHWAPDDSTTLKFTSGSTGVPKAVMASVGSIESSLAAVQQMFAHGPGDDVFGFLPLSLLQQRYWVYSAFAFGHDVTISTYEAAYAALRRSRPTVVMGVPAFYETARRHIEMRAARDEGQDSEAALRAAAQNLFGGRIRYLWTGSAPAAPSLLEFFGRCALPIFEGYGLNETCIVSKNHPGAHRQGSVGQVLPGKRVEIDDDGVLLIHSDHPVAEHYTYAEPSASERVFRPGGVVRTGDLGYLDEDGFLFVRGRADDMLVLGNGRKIDVRPGEESLRAHPAVHECVLYCPDQTDLVAVISPAEGAGADAVASALAAANARLRPDEQIARVVLARQAFTVENELLTSQFKPRRPQIYNQYRTEIHDRREGIHAIR